MISISLYKFVRQENSAITSILDPSFKRTFGFLSL